jgi:hypothetical protein
VSSLQAGDPAGFANLSLVARLKKRGTIYVFVKRFLHQDHNRRQSTTHQDSTCMQHKA